MIEFGTKINVRVMHVYVCMMQRHSITQIGIKQTANGYWYLSIGGVFNDN